MTIIGAAAEHVPAPTASASSRPNRWSRIFELLCAGIFALFILGVAAVALLAPERNWDRVAYVALAIEDQYEDAEALHAASWETMRQNTTEEEFTILTEAGAYRQAQFADADNFVSQLPMYQVKIGYTALVEALSPYTGPVAAMDLINGASVLILGGSLLWWLWRQGALDSALLLVPLLMISGLVVMARLGTPDMLAAALTAVGTMLLFSRMTWFGPAVLVAAFLVRPDTIIFLFALVLASLAFRWRRIPALAAFGIAAGLTVPLASGADHIGWWPHFWFSTIGMQANMEAFDPAFSLGAYLHGFARGVGRSLIAYSWPAVALSLLIGAWFVLRERREVPKDVAVVMLASVLAVGGKFAVFPMPFDRVYAVHLWLFATALLTLWRPQIFPRAGWAGLPGLGRDARPA